MHILGFLGFFDRTLCPAKYNYGQTLANLSGNCPLSDRYQEHWNNDENFEHNSHKPIKLSLSLPLNGKLATYLNFVFLRAEAEPRIEQT